MNSLHSLFGARYRITFDPAYTPAHVPRSKLDPWMMMIPCTQGVIYPHSDKLLAVEVNSRLGRMLAEIPGLMLWQDGDGEKTFLFPLDLFPAVSQVVKPKRKRRLTEEQRVIARQRLARFAFRPAQKVAQTHDVRGQDGLR